MRSTPMKGFFKSKKPSELRKWANMLTLIRAVAGLPLVISLSLENYSVAWVLLFLAGISDILDGSLARMAGGGSEWGARLDPLSDKILLAGPLIWLSSEGSLPTWAIWLLLSREIIVSGWRAKADKGGPASLQGKPKTILQFSSLLLLLWPPYWGGVVFSEVLRTLGWWIFWPSLLVAISSGITYLKPQAMTHLN